MLNVKYGECTVFFWGEDRNVKGFFFILMLVCWWLVLYERKRGCPKNVRLMGAKV